jgi:hypothetical protein
LDLKFIGFNILSESGTIIQNLLEFIKRIKPLNRIEQPENFQDFIEQINTKFKIKLVKLI